MKFKQRGVLKKFFVTGIGYTSRNIGKMIDAHCHLTAPEFDNDRDAVIQAAKMAGVESIVVVSQFASDFAQVMALKESYPDFIHPCLGLHPIQNENKCVSLSDFDDCKNTITEYKDVLAGIGEIGLDFTPHYIKSPEDKEIQRNVFRKQIALAREFDLAVNVHSRSAGRPVVDILIEEGATKVLLHAFDGNPKVARRGVEAGFYFSVPPSVIRSEQTQKFVSKIPLSNLLLETDSPALGPEKQVRNVPSNLIISCNEVARIKGISSDIVKEETTRNCLKLFGSIK